MNNKPKLKIDNIGIKRWILNGILHREDGPAVIWPDGSKFWYVNDKLHRIDGPAIIHFGGYNQWYLNNKQYTYEEWFNKLTPEQQINYLWNLDEE